MTSHQGLGLRSLTGRDGIDLGDNPAPTDDREAFATVLDGIEELREVPRRLRCAHLRHKIILSDRRGETWTQGGTARCVSQLSTQASHRRTTHCRKHASARFRPLVPADRRPDRRFCTSAAINYDRTTTSASDGSIHRYQAVSEVLTRPGRRRPSPSPPPRRSRPSSLPFSPARVRAARVGWTDGQRGPERCSVAIGRIMLSCTNEATREPPGSNTSARP